MKCCDTNKIELQYLLLSQKSCIIKVIASISFRTVQYKLLHIFSIKCKYTGWLKDKNAVRSLLIVLEKNVSTKCLLTNYFPICNDVMCCYLEINIY